MTNTQLVLGWKITRGFDPAYWLKGEASAGGQTEDDLVTIPANSVASHTAIIAQSGSGKSFFLGRLLEEILLKTKAKCIILDPNGDFMNCQQVIELEEDPQKPCMWNRPKYDFVVSLGRLTHEKERDEFSLPWQAITKEILTSDSGFTLSSEDTYQTLSLPWTTLSSELLSADLDPLIKGQVLHCHEFVCAVSQFHDSGDLLSISETLLTEISTSTFSNEHGREMLARRLKLEENVKRKIAGSKSINTWKEFLQSSKGKEAEISFANILGLRGISSQLLRLVDLEKFALRRIEGMEKAERQKLERSLDTLLKVEPYIKNEGAQFYFGKARIIEESGIFSFSAKDEVEKNREKDLRVIALSSIQNLEVRRMAVSAVIETEYKKVRTAWEEVVVQGRDDRRTPTFIVIDEAHNLIPSDAQPGTAEAALLQQFRTIAAEGRKYGIFLLIVSQRPDKLDERIVSECENQVIMRINSHRVLGIAKRLLGLEDLPEKLIEKCLDFPKGRALLTGDWSKIPQEFLGAARRTVEGGKNLDKGHWASPRPTVLERISKQKFLGKSLHDAGMRDRRSINILVNSAGILTVSDLTGKSAKELLSIKGFGKQSLANVRRMLKEMDLDLRED